MPNLIDRARAIVAAHSAEEIDGVLLDVQTAAAIVTVHDALNETNRAKFAALTLPVMAAVAWKLVTKG